MPASRPRSPRADRCGCGTAQSPTRHHHQPTACPEEHRSAATLVHVAEWLAEQQGFGWNEVGATLCDSGWEALGMSLESADAVLAAFAQSAKDSEWFASVLESRP